MLLGGSPLRLLRLSAPARALLPGDRLVVRDARTAGLAGRLLDAGLAHPDLPAAPGAAGRRHRRRPGAGPPRGPRPPARRAAGRSRDRRSAGGRRRRRLARPGRGRAGSRRVRRAGRSAADVSGGPAAARERGPARGPDRPRRLPRLRLRAPPRLAGRAAAAPGRPAPGPGRAAHRRPARRPDGLDVGRTRRWPARSTWGSARRRCARGPRSPTCPAPPCWPGGRRWARASTRRCASRRTWTWCGGWSAPGGGCATSRAPSWSTSTRWRRRTGCGGAPSTARGPRCSPRGTAPARRAGGPRAHVGGGLGAAGGRRPAGRGPGGRAARRRHRPAVPPAAPVRTGPRRPGSPPALVLRGAVAAGRSLARAVTRHHWPPAVAAARRPAGCGRGCSAPPSSTPRPAGGRSAAGSARSGSLLARRLDDLAYGAGLWWGAARARDPRALLPARPPGSEPCAPEARRRHAWWNRQPPATMGVT